MDLLVDITVDCNSPVIRRLGVGEEQIADSINYFTKDKEVYIYEDKGFIVLDKSSGCQIYFICVREDDQDQGIGTELVEFVEDRAKELKFDKVYLYTSDKDNESAINFFESLGYIKVNVSKEHYADGSAAILYSKKI